VTVPPTQKVVEPDTVRLTGAFDDDIGVIVIDSVAACEYSPEAVTEKTIGLALVTVRLGSVDKTGPPFT
jgi:hypothetical protein